MNKVKVNFHYQYLGEELGAIPYIHIGYVNESGEEKDALEVLYERTARAEIPHTGYIYGKTEDGEDFKVENYSDVPKNAQTPFYGVQPEYGDLYEYGEDDIETVIKNAAIEVAKALGTGVSISYSVYDDAGYFSTSTEKPEDFKDEKLKNALISGIRLSSNISTKNNFSLEDKVRLISIFMSKLFEIVRKRKLGFTADNNTNASIEFEVEGLSLDLIKTMPGYDSVIQNAVLNHSRNFSRKVKMGMYDAPTVSENKRMH